MFRRGKLIIITAEDDDAAADIYEDDSDADAAAFGQSERRKGNTFLRLYDRRARPPSLFWARGPGAL